MERQDNSDSSPPSAEEDFLRGGSAKSAHVARLRTVPQERLIQSYLTVILRYKMLIAFVAIFVISGTTYISLKMPKRYSAHAVVSLGSYLPSTEVAIARMLRDDMQSDSYIQDRLILLSSLTTADTALTTEPSILPYLVDPSKLPRPQKDKNGNVIPPELSVEVLKKYLGHTGHELIRGSTMVKVIGNSTNPKLSAKIANAQAYAFVEESRRQLLAVADVSLKALGDRVKEKEAVVEKRREALRKYVKEHAYQITQAGNEGRSVNLKLQNTINALSAATLARASTQRRMYELGSSNATGGLGLSASGRSKYIGLKKNLDEMELLRRRNADPNAWWFQEKRREIELARSELKLERKQKKQDAEIEYLANVERERLLKSELEKINKELAGTEGDRVEKARIQLEYSIMQSELAAAKGAYAELLRGLEQARLAGNSDLLTVKVIDEAAVPGAPSSPNVKFNILMGCVFGLMLGIALAYTLAFADNTVRSSKQLASLLGIKILGIVPSFSGRGSRYGQYANEVPEVADDEKIGDSSLLVLERPESLEAESFRSLRTMIMHSFQQANEGKVLLVTSGLPLDGKSTIVGNLAISFGKTEETTVLIEGDIRKPSLHTKFGLPEDRLGLSDYLIGKCGVDDILVESPVDSLQLILAGTSNLEPGELLDSKRMRELIDILSERYEKILLDSPPLSQISDALLLSKYSDGVLLVVRSGQTPKPVAEHAVARLQQIDAPIIGTVLNDLKKESSYGDGEYYSLLQGHYYRK